MLQDETNNLQIQNVPLNVCDENYTRVKMYQLSHSCIITILVNTDTLACLGSEYNRANENPHDNINSYGRGSVLPTA